MDTNLVLPLGSRTCLVIFDYFLDASLKVTSVHIPRIYQTEILVSQLRRIFSEKKKENKKICNMDCGQLVLRQPLLAMLTYNIA